jgi:hypothetical protein
MVPTLGPLRRELLKYESALGEEEAEAEVHRIPTDKEVGVGVEDMLKAL